MAEVEINPVQKPQFVNGVDNSNPIRIHTVAPHGLETGAFAFVCHVQGNTCANVSFSETAKIDDDTFDFVAVSGLNPPCGVYTSGGVYTPARETIHEVYGSGSGGLVGQGPWVYNGLLHTLISDSGDGFAGVAGLFVMRRNAGGAWVKLDTGSAFLPPGSPSVGRSTLGVFRRGNDIWIMRRDTTGPAENAVSLSTLFMAPQKFDLSTGAWSAVENSGTLPRRETFISGTPPNGIHQKVRDLSELVVRSTGELIFMHTHFRDQAADTRWYARVWYQRRSAGGTWDATPIRVFGIAGEQVNYSSRDMCIDADDRTHFFGLRFRSGSTWPANSSEGEIVYRNLDSSNVLSAQTAIADEVFSSDITSPVGPPFIYTKSGGGEEIVLPFVKGYVKDAGTPFARAAIDSLVVLRATAGASPVWVEETIVSRLDGTTAMPAANNLPGGNRDEMHIIASFAYNAATNTLHAFWQTDPNQVSPLALPTPSGNPSEVYHSQNSGAGWSTPDLFKTGNGLTSNWNIEAAVPITDAEQPVWYGQPVPTLTPIGVEVIFGRFAKWQVEDCGQQGSFASVTRTHEFPHIDQFNPCPPASSSRRRYAYFRQLPC